MLKWDVFDKDENQYYFVNEQYEHVLMDADICAIILIFLNVNFINAGNSTTCLKQAELKKLSLYEILWFFTMYLNLW